MAKCTHANGFVSGHCPDCGANESRVNAGKALAASRNAAPSAAPAQPAPAPSQPKGDKPVTEDPKKPVRRRPAAKRSSATRRPTTAARRDDAPNRTNYWWILAIVVILALLIGSRFVNVTPRTAAPAAAATQAVAPAAATAPFNVGSCGLKPGMRLDYEKSVEYGRCEYVALQPTPATAAVPAPITAPAAQQPTAVPAPVVQATALAGIDTAYVKKVTGVDVQKIGTESGAWVFRSPNDQLTDLTVPSGFIATIHKGNSEIVVAVGRGQTYKAKAATLRYQPLYPQGDAVWDAQKLFEKERSFAQAENPSYVVTLER